MKKKLLAGLAVGGMIMLGMSGVATSTTLVDTTSFTVAGANAPGDLIDYGQNGDTKEFADAWVLNNEEEYNSNKDFLTWIHSFTFSPEVHTITSASLSITFNSDRDTDDNSSHKLEWAYVQTEGNSSWVLSSEIDDGAQPFFVSLADLIDGSYKVTLSTNPRIISNDAFGSDNGTDKFWVTQSDLTINYEPIAGPPANPVPEPATMLLFGTGLLGLATRSRRKNRKEV